MISALRIFPSQFLPHSYTHFIFTKDNNQHVFIKQIVDILPKFTGAMKDGLVLFV